MADKINSGGITPPERPEVTDLQEKQVGTLGDKSVTRHDPDHQPLKKQQPATHIDTLIADRSVAASAKLSNDNLKMIRSLVINKQWDGVRSALGLHVTSLDHFDQLAKVSPENIPVEGAQIIANRYSVLAAARITDQLANIEGTAKDQLDSLNLFFVQPHSPHNPVRTVVRAVTDDFIQASGFPTSLKQSLTDQMETAVFHQLHHHALKLDRQVIASGDDSIRKLVEQQATQRKIEIGA